MSTATMTASHASSAPGAPRFTLPKFGMLVFLASEAMLFAGLIGGYIVLRLAQGPGNWPPPGAPDIGIQISLTYHWGEASMRKGKSGLLGYGITAVLGAIFLGVQAWEWLHLKHEGMWFNTFGIYGSCFFTMTGFHGAHVFLGLVAILYVVGRAIFRQMQLFSGQTPKGSHTCEELTGYYWHFVDVVWVFLYGILYVL
ncbi:MAG: heme-copper oxidase subunit III [Verrucomicrobia bacterium]|nr:heme-copper oxidase subunit III [Verrucomicrobiota bacterium]